MKAKLITLLVLVMSMAVNAQQQRCKTCGNGLYQCPYMGNHPAVERKCPTCGEDLSKCRYLGKHRGNSNNVIRVEATPSASTMSPAEAYELGAKYAKEGRFSQAIEYLSSASDRGHAEAQWMMALAYENGYGVQQSHAEAAALYRKAAEQGHAISQFNLGVHYEFGQGVQQSYTEAVTWYKKAAEQGFPNAQYNLAICYYNGHGVQQSQSEAAKWFKKAADQGLEDAQNAIRDLGL